MRSRLRELGDLIDDVSEHRRPDYVQGGHKAWVSGRQTYLTPTWEKRLASYRREYDRLYTALGLDEDDGNAGGRSRPDEIVVQAGISQHDLENRGATVAFRFDTLKEAKAHARYYLSPAYTRKSETSTPLGYARVLVDGEVVYDVGE
jgi:hypothetical protein